MFVANSVKVNSFSIIKFILKPIIFLYFSHDTKTENLVL